MSAPEIYFAQSRSDAEKLSERTLRPCASARNIPFPIKVASRRKGHRTALSPRGQSAINFHAAA
jgi:hypothetical protein